MPITIGTQLGSYEITALLGKGGMGEVYRAKDTKLKRDVAIKILPDEFSIDGDRVSRFQREAEVLASLNHPNIAEQQLWLRPIEALQAQPMPTTEDATYPFWSPDSRYIGF